MSEALLDFNRKKLATIDRIRRDGRLSSSTRMIGAEIFSLVEFRTGDAWPSVMYLAERLCLADRTIKRATAALKAAGYIAVDKRGRSNRYRPVFEPVQQGTNCPLSDGQQGTDCPPSDAKGGQKRPEQGTKTTANRGQKGPPTSLEITLGLPAPAPAARAGVPDGAGASGHPDRLGGFASVLEAKIGPAHFKSWLGKAALISAEGDTLTLAAPTQFAADHIRNFFGGSILECWQTRRPEILRLEVIVAKGLAEPPQSAVASIGARRNEVSADARWLVEAGIGLVAEQLRVTRQVADKTVVDWLKRCGNDAAGLRKIISDAVEQQLIGDNFSNVVKQRTKALLFADQTTLPLTPVALRRSAS
jgi:hypothetical protein